jgi:hypothetical protein
VLETAIRFFVPNPAGALWIGALVMFVVFGNWNEVFSKRNFVLAALLVQAVFLLEVIKWGNQTGSGIPRWGFTAIYLTTAAYAAWGLTLSLRGTTIRWQPNLPERGLRALVAVIVLINVAVVFGRSPDDAGIYTNLGARRWAETGVLPYGDLMLRGPDAPGYGAAATYGPLLYASHLPAQWLVGTRSNPADVNPMDESYVRPKVIATQLTCFIFYLLSLGALFISVRALSNPAVGWGAVALYAASPYVIGLGGDDFVVGGLAFISHIAPVAVMLLAFMTTKRPLLSGALLAAAAGVLFFPLFVFPAWLGWRVWRKEDPLQFAAGFIGAGLAIAILVVAFTPAPEGSNAITMFLSSTLEHQEGIGLRQYGGSTFGFWGTHPGLAAFWQAPLWGSSSLLKPSFLVYALFCVAAFFLARGRSLAQLAGLTAALTAGVQLWKTHAAGSYVEWYLPFLIVAIICHDSRGPATRLEAGIASDGASPVA